ncbi:hypothetical protein AVEN_175619-1, partial [Araneus ventricosus]
ILEIKNDVPLFSQNLPTDLAKMPTLEKSGAPRYVPDYTAAVRTMI